MDTEKLIELATEHEEWALYYAREWAVARERGSFQTAGNFLAQAGSHASIVAMIRTTLSQEGL